MTVHIESLRCPETGLPLIEQAGGLTTVDGATAYPIVDGVPVLMAPGRTAVPIPSAAADGEAEGRLAGLARRLAYGPPTISRSVGTTRNLERFAALAAARARREDRRGRVLVVGGARAGVGFDRIEGAASIDTVETDVAIGPRTEIVCDAHDLPFADSSFDGVLCQAVLEHVIDPARAVAEIHRVLVADGVVYSEIPFMQQVHEGAYDFQRFTHLGHLLLFRMFDELASGAQGGPGMALAWSVKYFLASFAGNSRPLRAALARIASLTTFWLKYLDEYLVHTPGGVDAASGTFFLGRARTEPVSDREIVSRYRGAIRR